MSGAGKGSAPRPVNPTTYGENYDDIFRKAKQWEEKSEKTTRHSAQEDQDTSHGKSESPLASD